MTGPRYASCRCGHTREAHDTPELRPQCIRPGCTCLRYRPDIAQTGSSLRPAKSAPASRTLVPAAPSDKEPDIVARGERGPSLEQILQAGKRSKFQRTVKLTEKIAESIHDLRGRLQDERVDAEKQRQEEQRREVAKKRVAELEAQLADARAELRSGKPVSVGDASPGATRSVSGQSIPCTTEGCDRTFASPQARAMHQRRAHEGFDPNAPKAAAS